MPVPAIVTAGDGSAARAVCGESKVYLEIEGRPLVARVVAALQRVPEVSEVWVIGNAERLEQVFSRSEIRAELVKPLHILPQFRHLWENCWEAYRRVLPGAGPDGRDPESESDLEVQPLFLSGDLPFATPQEISEFIRRAQADGCDYAAGVVLEEALESFLPSEPGGPGIQVAYFNMREARVRQSNLHLVKPGRLGNRHYIEEMYQHRHQREFWDMLALAWTLLRSRQGGFSVLLLYSLMHLAGIADRWRWRQVADWLRNRVSQPRVEAAVSKLLATRLRFIATEVGGCAVDVDTEQEYDTVRQCFAEWSKSQAVRAEALYGPLPLPEPGERG